MIKKSLNRIARTYKSQIPGAYKRREEAPWRPPKNLAVVLREWHRRIGLFAFIFMAWLGASGIFLNQSAAWGLDATRVDWSWLMSAYGLHTVPPENGFEAGKHWLAAVPEGAVLDGKLFDSALRKPVGMVEITAQGKSLLYLAGTNSIVIATQNGKRFDELSSVMLPLKSIERIGTYKNATALAIGAKDNFVSADGGLSWNPVSPDAVQWSRDAPLKSEQREAASAYARPSMPIEQILIDMHSGRIFGRYGEYLIDVVGFATLILSISGIWIVMRSNSRRPPGR